MPIPVTCPNGHKMRVKDALGGKRVACPKCKAPFRIPTVDEFEADVPPPELLDDRPAAKPAGGGKTCPSCGTALASDSVLCVECGLDLRTGKSLQGAGASTRSAAQRKKQSRRPKAKRSKSSINVASPKILLPAGGAAALVAVALAVYFFVLGSSSPEATARAFMAASEGGDVEAIKALLTTKAREFLEGQPAAMPAGGIGGMGGLPGAEMPEISYRVGRATTEGDTAKVPVTTEVTGPMGQIESTGTLLMRRENGRWLVYGVTASAGDNEMTFDFENPQALADTFKQSLSDALPEQADAVPGALGRRSDPATNAAGTQSPGLSSAAQPATGELDVETSIPGFPQYRIRPPKGLKQTQVPGARGTNVVWMDQQGSALTVLLGEVSESEAGWSLDRDLANVLAGLRDSLAGSPVDSGESQKAQISGIDFLRVDVKSRVGPQEVEVNGFCYVGRDGRTLIVLNGVEQAQLNSLDLLEQAALSFTKESDGAPAADPASAELDAEITVPGLQQYRIQPPRGYEMQRAPNAPSGVEVLAWVGPPRSDGTSPMVMIVRATPPAGAKSYSAEEALVKDLASLRRSKGAGFQSTPVDPIDIDGMAFVGAYWTGTHPNTGRKLQGFTFAALDGADIIYLKSQDSEPHHEASLKLAEASILTFRKATSE